MRKKHILLRLVTAVLTIAIVFGVVSIATGNDIVSGIKKSLANKNLGTEVSPEEFDEQFKNNLNAVGLFDDDHGEYIEMKDVCTVRENFVIRYNGESNMFKKYQSYQRNSKNSTQNKYDFNNAIFESKTKKDKSLHSTGKLGLSTVNSTEKTHYLRQISMVDGANSLVDIDLLNMDYTVLGKNETDVYSALKLLEVAAEYSLFFSYELYLPTANSDSYEYYINKNKFTIKTDLYKMVSSYPDGNSSFEYEPSGHAYYTFTLKPGNPSLKITKDLSYSDHGGTIEEDESVKYRYYYDATYFSEETISFKQKTKSLKLKDINKYTVNK